MSELLHEETSDHGQQGFIASPNNPKAEIPFLTPALFHKTPGVRIEIEKVEVTEDNMSAE